MFLVLTSFLCIPFSYLSFSNLRMILFNLGLLFLAVLFSFIRRGVIIRERSFCAMLLLIFLFTFYSFLTADYSGIYSVLAFSLICYWFVFFKKSSLISNFDRLLFLYIYSALFVALGILFQYFVYIFYNITLFHFERFGGGRSAFGFIWMDYSFLSLYVASAIPLVWKRFHVAISIFFYIVLIFSSIITSARTGVVSLILFFIIYLFTDFFRVAVTGNIKKLSALFFSASPLVFLMLLFLLPLLSGRALTISSSGRVAGYLAGLGFYQNNLLFGAMFDISSYVENITTIPHNVFIYMLVMGGSLAFFIFLTWLIFLFTAIKFADKRILSSVLVCFIGFQFIPSFFSAYFFATLLSLSFISSLKNKENLLKSRYTEGRGVSMLN